MAGTHVTHHAEIQSSVFISHEATTSAGLSLGSTKVDCPKWSWISAVDKPNVGGTQIRLGRGKLGNQIGNGRDVTARARVPRLFR
ncbi:hypothetical protein CLAIMM_08227 [Cladophialophora immunda]|nr:hypothetical protein CLAIMM_08227 [Cladophialophora immunda]